MTGLCGRGMTLLTVIGVWACVCLAADDPPLPEGLGPVDAGAGEPALPEGLGGLDASGDEPKLPEGLGDSPKPSPKKTPAADEPSLPRWLDLSGFWEVRGGVRTQHDDHQRDASIGETRLQLQADIRWQKVTFRITPDLVYDAVLDRHSVHLQRGDGFLDLREASAAFSPVDWMDVKVGRQVLTWGTGDLIFVNDLFPKDWRSFFIGRDNEYLKSPSDALKVSVFSDVANLDVVYVPRFDPDRGIEGRRISYWSGMFGRRAGRDAIVETQLPDEWFDDQEWHGRLYRTLGGVELAAYGYWGYWKSPAGMRADGHATYPRLSVYGGSARGPLGKGIANVEAGYYHSRQDADGDDPMVRNSELRLLAGYEQDLPEIAHDLTVGVQYYLEWMENHDAYSDSLPPGSPEADRARHVLTFRVTKLLMNQNLKLSMFAYYSPSDNDAYLRPKISYKVDDHWTVEVGGNVFIGHREHTFFGQFEKNSNVYGAVRYGF